MSHTPTNRERSVGADVTRTKQSRIARLRTQPCNSNEISAELVAVLRGILDLLEDEL